MCKTTDAIRVLTEEERHSLLEVGRGPSYGRIPFRHSEKFIGLGLTEVVMGHQELTASGRRAVQMMQR